jgi:5-methylthioribose kinase
MFGDTELFIQGRIDPYHRFTARAHPDLAPLIEAEVERMLGHRLALVHGDYSPKNLIVYGGPPAHVLMLDFEVAHWGDPAFDVAFCLAHLLLTAIHLPSRRREYLEVASAYCRGYQGGLARERDILAELGCLLLARIDGKSKEDYITTGEEREEARLLARWLLTEQPGQLGALWARMDP